MILIDDYAIDCVLEENHERENEITKYPVESGAVITDHVQKRPAKVTIQGVVSDTPIGAMKTLREERTIGEGAFVGGLLSAGTGLGAESAFALDKLKEVWAKKEPVTITTTLGEYRNMIPGVLSIPRSKEHTGLLRFSATFEESTIVENVRVAIPSAAPRTSLGDKSTALPNLKAVQCLDRDSETGACLINEEIKRGADGKWRHAGGRELTKQELDEWSKDQAILSTHQATYDKNQKRWIDSKTGEPVTASPDRAYYDGRGQRIQKGQTTDSPWDKHIRDLKEKQNRARTPKPDPKPVK